jgi:hypothetical protein
MVILMRVLGLKIDSVAKVSKHGPMEKAIQVAGKMIRNMARARISGQTAAYTRVNGTLARILNLVNISTLMELNSQKMRRRTIKKSGLKLATQAI